MAPTAVLSAGGSGAMHRRQRVWCIRACFVMALLFVLSAPLMSGGPGVFQDQAQRDAASNGGGGGALAPFSRVRHAVLRGGGGGGHNRHGDGDDGQLLRKLIDESDDGMGAGVSDELFANVASGTQPPRVLQGRGDRGTSTSGPEHDAASPTTAVGSSLPSDDGDASSAVVGLAARVAAWRGMPIDQSMTRLDQLQFGVDVPLQQRTAGGTIPPRLFGTWKSTVLPPGRAKQFWDAWGGNETQLERVIATDDDCAALADVYPGLGSRYHALPMMVLKADICRVLLVYFFGGYYKDLDVDWRRPLGEWVNPTDGIVYGWEDDEHVCQWFFAAQPGDPCIANVIAHITALLADVGGGNLASGNAFRENPDAVIEMTGPGAWTDALQGCPFPPLYNASEMRHGVIYHDYASARWSDQKGYASWLDARKTQAGWNRQWPTFVQASHFLFGADSRLLYPPPVASSVKAVANAERPLLRAVGVRASSELLGLSSLYAPQRAFDGRLDTTYASVPGSGNAFFEVAFAEPMWFGSQPPQASGSGEVADDGGAGRHEQPPVLGCVKVWGYRRAGRLASDFHGAPLRLDVIDDTLGVTVYRLRKESGHPATAYVFRLAGMPANVTRLRLVKEPSRGGAAAAGRTSLVVAEMQLFRDVACALPYDVKHVVSLRRLQARRPVAEDQQDSASGGGGGRRHTGRVRHMPEVPLMRELARLVASNASSRPDECRGNALGASPEFTYADCLPPMQNVAAAATMSSASGNSTHSTGMTAEVSRMHDEDVSSDDVVGATTDSLTPSPSEVGGGEGGNRVVTNSPLGRITGGGCLALVLSMSKQVVVDASFVRAMRRRGCAVTVAAPSRVRVDVRSVLSSAAAASSLDGEEHSASNSSSSSSTTTNTTTTTTSPPAASVSSSVSIADMGTWGHGGKIDARHLADVLRLTVTELREAVQNSVVLVDLDAAPLSGRSTLRRRQLQESVRLLALVARDLQPASLLIPLRLGVDSAGRASITGDFLDTLHRYQQRGADEACVAMNYALAAVNQVVDEQNAPLPALVPASKDGSVPEHYAAFARHLQTTWVRHRQQC